ncbi:MAG: glycosyltransferase [Lachnospiraceae bacterium]
MRICHITCVHSRYDIRIFEKECTSLAKAGYEVYLVVNDDESDEEKNGVEIVSTGFKPKNRIERILKSADKVLSQALKVNAEVYHLHDPELLKIVKPLLKHGKKVVFDAHEDAEEQIKDKTWIPLILRNLVSKIYGTYSHKRMKMLDGIITVTPNFVKKYQKYNANVSLVTNYPIIGNESDREVPKELSGEKYVFFAGGISSQWCHERIAKAINNVDGVNYHFAGKGVKEYIDSVTQMSEKIVYCGVMEHKDVIDHYKCAIGGMAILDCAQVGKDGSLGNTKLFEVMQAGKPVICSDLRLWREIIEKYNCGICVNADDIDSISEALKYIVSNPEQAKLMGNNGRRAVLEEFNWSTQEKSLLELYKSIM